MYLSQAELQCLNTKLTQKLPELLEYFNIYPGENFKCYHNECMVHGGDAQSALNIYKDGFWCCRTHKCHKVFKNSIIGLVRGLLSHQKYNWMCEGDQTVSFKEALQFCLDFTNSNGKLESNSEDDELQAFIKQQAILHPPAEPENKKIDKAYIRRTLEIPDPYILRERGFTESLLRRYDIGACNDPKRKFYKRAVIPIYDYHHESVLGFTARSHLLQCAKCKLWHYTNDCPINKEEKRNSVKWLNSYHAPTSQTFFNIWFAKSAIQKTQSIILCEGPLDVLRLESYGIHNSVACFGSSFPERQQIIIEKLPVRKIIVLMDNDEAGVKCRDKIVENCGNIYEVITPKYEASDVEKMTKDEIYEILKKC